MVTKTTATTPAGDPALIDATARLIQFRAQRVTDDIELLEDALRPFRALEWLIRGGAGRAQTEGDLSHLERGDLAELIATLTDAAQAKVEATMSLSQLIWKA